MYLRMYLASDHPLPLVPPDQNDRAMEGTERSLYAMPGGHWEEENNDADEIRYWLKKPFLYCVGSHMGCACGFGLDEYDLDAFDALGIARPDDTDTQQAAFAQAGRASAYELASYLESVTDVGEVELLVLWHNKGADPPSPLRLISPAYFRGSSIGEEFVSNFGKATSSSYG